MSSFCLKSEEVKREKDKSWAVPAIVKPEKEFDYYEIDEEGLQEDADHEERCQ